MIFSASKFRYVILCSVAFVSLQCAHRATEDAKPIYAGHADMSRASFKAIGKKYAISTQGSAATEAARAVMAEGGNIVDAAIAASFVISVERPHSTGLAGGGFFLYREAASGKTYAIDFRERAPARATEKMFLDEKGEHVHARSEEGILSVGVPGVVAGLVEIHAKFGKLPLKRLIEPAITLAEKGFPIYPYLANAIVEQKDVLARDPAAAKLFLGKKGEPLPEGHVLVQKDLGKTLRLIAAKGRAGFYEGNIAGAMEGYFKRAKGLITRKDLADYKVKWREPVTGSFNGYEVYSMPPPSSGGVHVIQILKLLENDGLKARGLLSADSIHRAAASMQLAFADRAKYLGDPDYVKVPVKELTSDTYLRMRDSTITADRARKKDEIQAGDVAKESTDTTHLSIIDEEGNAVATTQTINGYFGANIVLPGTGLVLNNEMDDFSAKPGASNLFGAVGGVPNKIEPGKTPLSSMSPTFLVKDGKVQLSVGAPGGTRIITCVAQTILNWTEFGLPLEQAVGLMRYHHQWSPDVLFLDPPGPGPAVVAKLEKLGYTVKLEAVPCHVMAVAREGDILKAVSDPRDAGTGAGE